MPTTNVASDCCEKNSGSTTARWLVERLRLASRSWRPGRIRASGSTSELRGGAQCQAE